jgi:glycerol-3-phosphate acyltransferase PlsX
LRIGIDLMGGDNPPELLFSAITQAAASLSQKQSMLVIANTPVINQLSSLLYSSLTTDAYKRISFQECEDVISMSDDPLSSIRLKKNSSLVYGMRLLKKKSIDAFVSCGNTGALIASAALSLPLLSGVSHPALLVTLPTEKGPVALLDAGGNVLNKAQQMVRFAFLGAAYQRAMQGVKLPTVGLLNIGVESSKGTTEVRQAFEMLKSYSEATSKEMSDLSFFGNVEGRDLFKGTVDVLVTDGFTGNVLLKTAEGVASFIFEALKDKTRGMPELAFEKVFKDLEKQFNYAVYPGAMVCGVDGVVVKVHGNATAESLLASIFFAFECVTKDVISFIK